ncbi:MAG: hybrid sensor histidine kinase/response regulator [Desulfobacterales bacterium]|nr:hybrid sensor histidine kinase/response regulator [Desulfobacterales bacterium]MBF0396343.1 hybrid sensor histidine kinase/response regulator [Desulfobacterales bacterium]
MLIKMNEIKDSTILIVDDSPEVIGVLFNYLSNFDFKILIAQSGQDAIDIARGRKPDLILLDVIMPGMDGFETCKILKKDDATKDIPVLFLTGLTDTSDKIKGFEVGGLDYITKPFNQEEALARINTHISLKKFRENLSIANASKDKLFSIIAHDLRGPFGPIIGFCNILLSYYDKISDLERKDFINKIKISSEIVYKLLENLLEWVKIQRGIITFNPEVLNFHEIATEFISIFNHVALRKKITLTNEINETTKVFADLNMIKIVVQNLISNAIKFTREGGIVKISSQTKSNFEEINVSDNGIGISAKDLNNLFKIDVRQSKLGTAEEKGTGLGLILCKEFVEKNGGRIWVESEIDKGSIFKFTLPTA